MTISDAAPSTSTRCEPALLMYKNRIEGAIQNAIAALGKKTALRDACEYALTNGGKRFRPALVFMIADALGQGSDVTEAALAVEFFHTASLIADDLPCMDNDDMRRNRPSTHKVYGEATALLASYALIAAGYEQLAKNSRTLQASSLPFANQCHTIGMLALENVTYNTGILGATGGQFLDMHPSEINLATLIEIIQKKTVSLFEISFVLGWLYGGGDLAVLEQVKQAAFHFGCAFQIADDISDVEQDQQNGCLINIAALLGATQARERFHQEMAAFYQLLRELKVDSPALNFIAQALVQSMNLSQ